MSPNTFKLFAITRVLPVLAVAIALLLALPAYAAAPGIKGTTFDLTAQASYISQPDGSMIYSWGYGCNGASGSFVPSRISGANCPSMQIPGPTLIVTENQPFTVKLANGLPAVAGNTSILFPGVQLISTTGGEAGLLTQEATAASPVTYTLKALSPGTRSYYSGTQGDLQIEMGMYGAIIVLPATPPSCPNDSSNLAVEGANNESDFRLASAAYGNSASCYDREYLFQFSELDPRIHQQVEDQLTAAGNCAAGTPTCRLNIATEPYHPAYFMINGRSMPDDMDTNYAPEYPHQPYNGNPHMHPGELVLLRIIGQGHWQHPFHEHGNHVRILGRDGNLIVSESDATKLAGPLLFTTTTTPGLAMDGIFYWTGKGLNWDVFGHTDTKDPAAAAPCVPDSNGYYTQASVPPAPANAPNYYEWCADHNKALEKAPFGDVGGGGPVTLPDANILTNGAWYGGSAYLGPDATARAVGPNGTTPPSGTIANSPQDEAGFAFMWHSHNEREITTNNIFPGGMLMMMLVDPRFFVIDESK